MSADNGKKRAFGSPIIFWVHQLAHLSRRQMLTRFKNKGVELTPEQWSLMVELWVHKSLSPSQLADNTGRDRPSTSRLIESLKKQNLVERLYNEDDRRAYLVVLTDEGKKCHKALLPIYGEVLQTSVAGLSQEEQDTLITLLKKMYKNIENDNG